MFKKSAKKIKKMSKIKNPVIIFSYLSVLFILEAIISANVMKNEMIKTLFIFLIFCCLKTITR